MAAALAGEPATSGDLIDSAERAANILGRDANYYYTSFGPTNVKLHRAAALVELGEGGDALAVHDRIDPRAFGELVAERRAHHWLDMARACIQIGDMERAGRALATADRTAPAEIRCRPVAVELIDQILHRAKGEPAPEVRKLADEVGALN
ncbi:hypothetical protein GCM10029992_39400 [Glycomyces albus]